MVARPPGHIDAEALAANETVVLDLTNRGVRALPDTIGLVTSLQSLCLAGALGAAWCKLTSKACANGTQHRLTRCGASCTGCESIVSLPDSVAQLSSLRELDLTRCSSLKRLPDSVGGLQRLTNLQMPQCTSLSALPDSTGSLASLATLNAGSHRRPSLCQLPA